MTIDNPILNSPFKPPTRHFALDDEGAPTGAIVEGRRESAYVVPVAAPRHRRGRQAELELDEGGGKVTPNDYINELRRYVEGWRGMAQAQWGVTHETERLLSIGATPMRASRASSVSSKQSKRSSGSPKSHPNSAAPIFGGV